MLAHAIPFDLFPASIGIEEKRPAYFLYRNSLISADGLNPHRELSRALLGSNSVNHLDSNRQDACAALRLAILTMAPAMEAAETFCV